MKTSILMFPDLLAIIPISCLRSQPVNWSESSDTTARLWQGIPGLEVTEKGRIFISWFSGGPKEPAPENTVYLCYSNDHGMNFNAPQPMALPNEIGRAFDPTLWIDPDNRLWYIFNRGNKDVARHDVHARICQDPDAKSPVWSDEFRVGYDVPYSFRMKKT